MLTTINKNQNALTTKLLLLSGFFLVPALTLYLGTQTDLLYQNFTYLANQQTTKILFLFWALASLFTHFALLYNIYRENKLSHQKYIYLTFLFLLLAIFLPYPSGTSLLGFLHVFFGYVAFVLYNYVLFQLTLQTRHYNSKNTNRITTLYGLLLSLCLSIVLLFGSINGLAELFYFSCTPLLLTTYKLLIQQKNC